MERSHLHLHRRLRSRGHLSQGSALAATLSAWSQLKSLLGGAGGPHFLDLLVKAASTCSAAWAQCPRLRNILGRECNPYAAWDRHAKSYPQESPTNKQGSSKPIVDSLPRAAWTWASHHLRECSQPQTRTSTVTMSVVTVNPETFGQLADRVVVVTGGSSGIGLAAVRLLLSNGAKVVNVDQNDGPVSQSQDVSSYQFVKADVASWSELRGALSLPSTLSVSLIMCLRMLVSSLGHVLLPLSLLWQHDTNVSCFRHQDPIKSSRGGCRRPRSPSRARSKLSPGQSYRRHVHSQACPALHPTWQPVQNCPENG